MTLTTSHPKHVVESGSSFGPALLVAMLARVMVMVCLLLQSHSATGQEAVRASPNEVEAAFLRNFARYVTWPTNAFAATNSPWNIGILGDDLFGDVLEKTFNGRSEQTRSFEVFRGNALTDLPPCQIIFVAYKDAAKRRAALAELKNRPVLTVANASDFLQEGGIIRFQVKDRVEMGINLDQARAVSLKIPAKMLEVTAEVVENGVTRKLR